MKPNVSVRVLALAAWLPICTAPHAAVDSNADGKFGYRYTKISATGAELPATATAWSCVKDAVTGLMWEAKTADGGLHDANRSFDHSGSEAGYSTRAFVANVNAAGLCGHRDWRLPTHVELADIVDYGTTAPSPFDTKWFAYAAGSASWSDTGQSNTTEFFWVLQPDGGFRTLHASERAGARLVRGKA